jgi:cyclopropane-fatty-acyl-phospholipid synthase
MSAVEDNVRSSAEQVEVRGYPRPATAAPARSVEARMMRRLLSVLGEPPIEFVLWTGESITGSNPQVVARIGIKSRATLLGLVRDPQVRFGDAYSDGTISIDGDLVSLLEEIYRAGQRAGAAPTTLRKLGRLLHRRRTANTLEGSRENIHHHYDIGNEFYSLWLGDTMAYTCAYYPTESATLDEAQIAKFDHVCRKLRLQPGESVVEAGCGWGGLGMHMARRYGVKVRAFNISREQVAYARERAKREGLDSRVEFVLDDYRNITGKYDAFVSVGMLEHVGVENYPELGRVVSNSIGSNGRGLIHSIGRNRPAPLHPWITRRIFPGAYPPSLGEMMSIFEPWQLSVLDVENIRLHYAKTLHHWLGLYESSKDRVREMFDDKFVRMWRLYLAGSIAGFTTGTLQLFQVVFAPRGNNNIPLTRAHLYGG